MGPRNVQPAARVNYPDAHGVVKTQLLQFPSDPMLITALDGNPIESDVPQLSADAFAAAVREPSSPTSDRLRRPRGVGYSFGHDDQAVEQQPRVHEPRCDRLARIGFAYALRWALSRHQSMQRPARPTGRQPAGFSITHARRLGCDHRSKGNWSGSVHASLTMSRATTRGLTTRR